VSGTAVQRQPIAEQEPAVQLRIENRTAWITLNRPPLNILDVSMMRELDAALKTAIPKCDFLVFRGEGPKGFSAGADVADHTPNRVAKMLAAFHAIFRRLATADCVTVASVHGFCLGGGMELATFCDFVVATGSAEFGQPEIKLGCFPPIAMITLPELIGLRAASDLILTGRQIGAPEAQLIGLVARVVPDHELGKATDELLGQLRALSPAVLRLTRRTLWRLHAAGFSKHLAQVERIYLTKLMKSADAKEGIRAFLEKRAPAWQGK
jgi:cyclohexa-1,5-dienecarbonyl-CoA hydratase